MYEVMIDEVIKNVGMDSTGISFALSNNKYTRVKHGFREHPNVYMNRELMSIIDKKIKKVDSDYLYTEDTETFVFQLIFHDGSEFCISYEASLV